MKNIFLILVLFILIPIATPLILSSSFGNFLVEKVISHKIAADCQVQGASFSLSGPQRIASIKINQTEEFPCQLKVADLNIEATFLQFLQFMFSPTVSTLPAMSAEELALSNENQRVIYKNLSLEEKKEGVLSFSGVNQMDEKKGSFSFLLNRNKGEELFSIDGRADLVPTTLIDLLFQYLNHVDLQSLIGPSFSLEFRFDSASHQLFLSSDSDHSMFTLNFHFAEEAKNFSEVFKSIVGKALFSTETFPSFFSISRLQAEQPFQWKLELPSVKGQGELFIDEAERIHFTGSLNSPRIESDSFHLRIDLDQFEIELIDKTKIKTTSSAANLASPVALSIETLRCNRQQCVFTANFQEKNQQKDHSEMDLKLFFSDQLTLPRNWDDFIDKLASLRLCVKLQSNRLLIYLLDLINSMTEQKLIEIKALALFIDELEREGVWNFDLLYKKTQTLPWLLELQHQASHSQIKALLQMNRSLLPEGKDSYAQLSFLLSNRLWSHMTKGSSFETMRLQKPVVTSLAIRSFSNPTVTLNIDDLTFNYQPGSRVLELGKVYGSLQPAPARGVSLFKCYNHPPHLEVNRFQLDTDLFLNSVFGILQTGDWLSMVSRAELKLNKMLLNALLPGLAVNDSKISGLLKDTFITFIASLNQTSGGLSHDAAFSLDSELMKAEGKGEVVNGVFYFKRPIKGSFSIGNSLAKLFFSDDMLLSPPKIDVSWSLIKGALPLVPFKLRNSLISEAVLQLPSASVDITALQNKPFFLSEESTLLSIKSTPLYFNIEDGVIQLKRWDVMIADKLPFAIYGKMNLIRDWANLTVALPPRTIGVLFQQPDKGGEWLQIPLQGPLSELTLDKASLFTQIGSRWLNRMQNPIGAIFGGAFQTGMSSASVLPSPSTPLPWEVEAATGEEPQKETNLKKAIKTVREKSDKIVKGWLKKNS